MKKAVIFFSLLTLLLLAGPARAQNCQASKDLPNFGCVSPSLYRGAQPTEEGIKDLARRGIKTIINLRRADERVRIEEGWARSAGIKFINVPLSNWHAPKDAEINQIMKLLNLSENQPVFVHCKRGADRTGTVIAVYRINHDSWTAKRAKKEAKDFQFSQWQFLMRNYINNFYKEQGKQQSNLSK